MARFGNTGTSGLLRTASSSLNRINAYGDAMAAAKWDASAKTQDDLNTYKTYLNGRIGDTQNLDPTKALTLDNTARSATRTFNSAETGRLTTSIKYGDASNTDKYNQLANLRQQAIANGDYSQAQTLEGEMASTSIAIQNEAISAQNKADANSAKADAAQNKGFTHAISQVEDQVKQLNSAKLSGQISPSVYDDQMRQLYMGNAQTGMPGLINLVTQARETTGDPNMTYQNKLDTLAGDRQVQKYVNGNSAANVAVGNNFTQTIVKNSDGTYAFHDRPASELATDANGKAVPNKLLTDANGNPIKDAAGHAITIPQYAGATASSDKSGNVNGFQYATRFDSTTGAPAPGTGTAGGGLRQIDGREINRDDPSGVPYFYNEAGQKKFIGAVDASGKNVPAGTPGSHPIMANDPSVLNPNIDTGPQLNNPVDFYSNQKAVGDTLNAFKDGAGKLADGLKSASGVPIIGSGLASTGNLINSLINRNNAAATARQQAIDLAKAQAAAQARQAADALALHNQQMAQQKLLPVFRAPTPAPAPAPKNQYQLPALPAPVKLPGGSGISVPSGTGNNSQDILNLGRSLGNLM
jgi:hypothetical protein